MNRRTFLKIASMGSVAASGGYVLSMKADRVFANPSTITGSIGIFGMFDIPFVGIGIASVDKFHFFPLKDEADRSVETVHRRNASDGDALVLIDDFVLSLVVELGNLGLVAPEIDLAGASQDELIGYQLHDNEWYARKARQVLQMRAAAGELLQELLIFDVYRGKGIETGRKSIAFGLILQDYSRTLTEQDIEAVVAQVTDQLEEKFGATLRD